MKHTDIRRHLPSSCVILLALMAGCSRVGNQGASDEAENPSHGMALFVAPGGDDANPGTKAQPFATLERARDAIRKTKASKPERSPVTVFLLGGTYRIDKPIEFTPEDSGTAEAPITYRAYGPERPIISGGRPIIGWRKAEGAIWQAELPRYRLAITPAGDKGQVFDRLPFLHPEFRQLMWFGFSSSGKPGAVFHVDNIRLETVGR